MGKTYDVRVVEVLPTGEYPAKIIKIEEATGQYGPQLKWEFELKPIDGKAHKLTGWSSAELSTKTKFYRWVSAAFGVTAFDPTAQLDIDTLIGKPVILSVTRKMDEKGQPFNKVEELYIYKPQATPAPAPQPSPQPEGDW
jgi:hypothetical protein